MQHININQLQELQDLLEDEFDGLIVEYMNESKTRINTLKTALQQLDNASGYDAAHSLKGASINIGATRLAELCYKMQLVCKERQITDAEVLVESIVNEQNAVFVELKAYINL